MQFRRILTCIDRIILSRLFHRVEAVFGTTLIFMVLSLNPFTLVKGLAASSFSESVFSKIPEMKDWIEDHRWAELAQSLKPVCLKDLRQVSCVWLPISLTYSGKRQEGLEVLIQMIGQAKKENREALIAKARSLSQAFLTNTTFQIYQDGLDLLGAKKFKLARERFERALTKEPENVEIILRLSQSQILEAGLTSEAIESLSIARKLNPYEPRINLWLGRALFLKGDLPGAVQQLTLANRSLSNVELAPLWLAEALLSMGQNGSAIQTLEMDTKKYPFHILSLITLARFRLHGRHSDRKAYWAARRDLQLALSRLGKELSPSGFASETEGDSELILSRSPSEIKNEIYRLLQVIENRLQEAT